MWTNDLLKKNAKTVLSRSYWSIFLVCLVGSVLTGDGLGGLQFRINGEQYSNLASAIGALAGSAVAIAYTLLAGNVIAVGWRRYMMESRGGKSTFDTLFSGFSAGYGNLVAAQFSVTWRVTLSYLLLIVPGIIKSYEYRMVPYLLAENPQLPPERARQLSSAMTDGEKMNIFLLDLSFVGWILLGALCLGVGVLFVAPYMEATRAELYAALRAKAFSMGVTGPEELGGFRHYDDTYGF